MPTANTLAAAAELAHGRALEVVREHGPAERAERLDNITVTHAVVSNPHHLVTFQAELLASLAEIIEGQHRRISELETAAREAATAAEEKEKPAASTGDKGPQKKRGK